MTHCILCLQSSSNFKKYNCKNCKQEQAFSHATTIVTSTKDLPKYSCSAMCLVCKDVTSLGGKNFPQGTVMLNTFRL